MHKRIGGVALAALSLSAGYGVYDSMLAFYPVRGAQEAVPGYSDGTRVAAGVVVAVLFGTVMSGLARLARSQPSADRGMVLMAWSGWVLFGTSLAIGWSVADAAAAWNQLHYRLFLSWIVTRGLMAGLVWAGIVLIGLSVWQRGRVAIA